MTDVANGMTPAFMQQVVTVSTKDITNSRRAGNTHYCLVIGDLNANVGKKIDNTENIKQFDIGNRNAHGVRRC